MKESKLFDTSDIMSDKRQRVLLAWVVVDGRIDKDAVLNELKGLVDTAGGETADVFIQNRSVPDQATLFGSGKLKELALLSESLDINLIVFENNLTPVQLRNIEREVKNCRIIDRTALILDIFALHAKTAEGKLQVELAQLKYFYPRLSGLNDNLSRQGGGIGTRGPGETKLETDKRYIKNRIRLLNEKIKLLEKHRKELHKQREKSDVYTVVLVGYTNAGKSSLLNALTSSDVLVADRLFATLDPFSRKLDLGNGTHVILVDTVGFIRNIPTDLIAAFKSTLEETVHADLIINVCDASSPECESNRQVTLNTLNLLGAKSDVITVYNKSDKIDADVIKSEFQNDTVFVSAKTGFGLENLKNKIQSKLFQEKIYCEFEIPYIKAGEIAEIRGKAQILKEIYDTDKVIIKCDILKKYIPLYEEFLKTV